MANFMFFKDKYENGILEVRITIRIAPSAFGDVPESGHLRNHIPTGNLGVKFHIFQRQVRKCYFESTDHYLDCPGFSRGCSEKRTFLEPYSYRQYWCHFHVFQRQIRKWPFQVF